MKIHLRLQKMLSKMRIIISQVSMQTTRNIWARVRSLSTLAQGKMEMVVMLATVTHLTSPMETTVMTFDQEDTPFMWFASQ